MDQRGYIGKPNTRLALRRELMTALSACKVETSEADRTVEPLTRTASVEPTPFHAPPLKTPLKPVPSVPRTVDTPGTNRPKAVASPAPKPARPTEQASSAKELVFTEACVVAGFVYRSFAIPELADLIIAGIRMAIKTGRYVGRCALPAPQERKVAT